MFVPATRLNALGAIGVLLLLGGGLIVLLATVNANPELFFGIRLLGEFSKEGNLILGGVLTLLGTVCILVRSAICEVVPCQYVRR
jgi:hypothetical protein